MYLLTNSFAVKNNLAQSVLNIIKTLPVETYYSIFWRDFFFVWRVFEIFESLFYYYLLNKQFELKHIFVQKYIQHGVILNL